MKHVHTIDRYSGALRLYIQIANKAQGTVSYFLIQKFNFMATFEKGILGGFSGKVGNIICGNWKGIDYMRSKANKRTFVPSQKQLEQQLKFALMMRFLQPMSGLLGISFYDFAIRKTGINSAFAYNFSNAITGTFPDYAIDYSKALVSRGNLPNVLGPSVVSGAGSILTWSWTDNNSSEAKPTDQAILVAYCPAMKQAIFTTNGGERSDLTAELNLLTFTGQQVETYIGFVSPDGHDVSVSLFTGEVLVR
ncbi:MAG: DUF6266 family protein [Ginsengibacter sp.]